MKKIKEPLNLRTLINVKKPGTINTIGNPRSIDNEYPCSNNELKNEFFTSRFRYEPNSISEENMIMNAKETRVLGTFMILLA